MGERMNPSIQWRCSCMLNLGTTGKRSLDRACGYCMLQNILSKDCILLINVCSRLIHSSTQIAIYSHNVARQFTNPNLHIMSVLGDDESTLSGKSRCIRENYMLSRMCSTSAPFTQVVELGARQTGQDSNAPRVQSVSHQRRTSQATVSGCWP